MSFFEKQKFNPGLISIFFHPFFFIRKELFKFINTNSEVFFGKMLDFGGGSSPYKSRFKNIIEYISIEVESDKNNISTKLSYDGHKLPFTDNEFDSILCTEVLEHVNDVEESLDELYRVLKPGGKLLVTTPFICVEHENPHDYRRFTMNGLKQIIKKKGFEIVSEKKLLNNINVIFQTINFYLVQLIGNGIFNKFRYILYPLFVGPINITSVLLNIIFPKINELYFGSALIIKK